MRSLPLSVNIDKTVNWFIVYLLNADEVTIGWMKFRQIDQAMFFINPFAAEQMQILNPLTLKFYLETESEVPYVFYESSGRINRRETIRRVMETTDYKTVKAIHEFTGFPIQRIHESISRFKAET